MGVFAVVVQSLIWKIHGFGMISFRWKGMQSNTVCLCDM